MTARGLRSGRLTLCAALLAPFVAVQAGRQLGAFGPGVTNAAPTTDAPMAEPVTPTPPTPEQERAVEWSRAHAAPRTSRSPLRTLEVPAPPTPIVPMPIDEPAPEPPGAILATLHVNSIMGQGEKGIAVINRRVLRLGDEAAPGWRIVAISARDRSVDLEGPAGRVERLELGRR